MVSIITAIAALVAAATGLVRALKGAKEESVQNISNGNGNNNKSSI